jgi:3-oxo-5alpha-steroid 4-dehydrogenase
MSRPRPAADVDAYDLTADVIVVGLGIAGVAAALEAVEAGADTLVLEAAAAGGGTSALSGGIVYLGGGTPVQEACGFDDTAENMARFLAEACGPGVDRGKLEAFCEGSVELYHWLTDHGLEFEHTFYATTAGREPPDTSGLIYSGGEDAHPGAEVATPAPRGHHPRYPDAAGVHIMDVLLAELDRTAARVLTSTTVERLIVDGHRVVGVEARAGGKAIRAEARGGVALTAGGFVFNDDMVARHTPELLRANLRIGTDHDDGRGIRMAQAVGAATINMSAFECAVPITPPLGLMRGVIVNARGLRFVNEDAYTGRIGIELLARQDGEGYLIVDEDVYEVNLVGMQAMAVAETIEELAEEIRVPADALAATLDVYNRNASEGRDPLFHKRPEMLKPLAPPLGIIDLRVESTFYAVFTLGGLWTDADGAVLSEDGEAIAGLHAAGRTTSGIAVRGYVSGISLADGLFFGRRAGRSAAIDLAGTA